jgi:predicted aldo/keto reductase-like oxidoreductase
MMSEIPKRPLGSTGEQISIIGVGGGHLGNPSLTAETVNRIIHHALDYGVNFLDNAWEYHEGRSEMLMGRAISDRRDKVFLMTKVCARDRAGAERNLHDSLRRLRTDYIDLWQFHEVNYGNDPEWIFGPGGAAEAALAALEAGKVRFVGFTGHKDPAFHLKMLEYDFPWSSAQMPINVLDASFKSFLQNVVPVCNERNIGVIGMKGLGGHGELIEQGGIPAEDCRRFALSQPITCLVCGMTSLEQVEQDVGVARDFEPMSQEEQDSLIESTRGIAGDGHLELYKTTQRYDSQPHRDQHHFPDLSELI